MTLGLWMTGVLYLLLGGLIAALLIIMVIGYELLRRDFRRVVKADREAASPEKALMLQDQLNELKRQVLNSSQANQKELNRLWRKTDESIGDQLGRVNDLAGQLRQGLGAISDASRQIVQAGSQISELSEAMRLPAGGGSAGAELFLADLLGQLLPPQHFELNVSLEGGRPIHAIVRLGRQLIPIDAGFPDGSAEEGEELAGRARRHIDRVAAECIRPEAGTVDFALLYLPSERLYYDLVIRTSHEADSLCSYALSRRVVPVSPNTLYAYLYTVVLGMRGLKVEQEARRIMGRLDEIRDDFSQFEQAFRVVGSHMDHAASKYDQARRQLSRLGGQLDASLTGGAEAAQALPTDEGGEADKNEAEGDQTMFSLVGEGDDAGPAAEDKAEEDAPEAKPDASAEGKPRRRRRSKKSG